jgi:hypothetical protein
MSKLRKLFEVSLNEIKDTVESLDDRPKFFYFDWSKLPSIELSPKSFLELLALYSGSISRIYIHRDTQKGYTYFGILLDGVLHWTYARDCPPSLKELYRFYEVARNYVRNHSYNRIDKLKEILSRFGFSNLDEFKQNIDVLEYGISLGLIRVKVEASWDYDYKELLLGERDEPEWDVKVEYELPFEKIVEYKEKNLKTYDEVLLWDKYGYTLDNIRPIFEVEGLIEEIVRDLASKELKKISNRLSNIAPYSYEVLIERTRFEIYDEPEIRDVYTSELIIQEYKTKVNRVKRLCIGHIDLRFIGRSYRYITLSNIFPLIEKNKNLIDEFKNSNFETFDEYILNRETKYTLDELKELIDHGAVWINRDGNYAKVTNLEIKDNKKVYLVVEGSEFRLFIAVNNNILHLPDYAEYENYKQKGYEYFIDAILNKKYESNPSDYPSDLEELKRLVYLGLVKVNDENVKDVKIKDREVFLILKDDSEIELYKVLAIDDCLKVSENLEIVRELIKEGYGDDPEIFNLALLIKRLKLENVKESTLAKLQDKFIKLNEVEIPISRLKTYLTSEMFTKFGKLDGDTFKLV